MAWQLSNYRESEKMIALGLAGNPPNDILEEFRDLFDKVNFLRHLTTKGIELSDDEFRFTLGSGDEVMKGFAKGDEVLPRILGIEALYSKTVQRMENRPYTTHGKLPDGYDNIIQMYYQTPVAASFAMVFKIPRAKQSQAALFPELEKTVPPYVDEMLKCLDLINQGKTEELRTRIPDDSYYQSFIINARKIAPDGKNIKQVGFTVYRNNEEKIHPIQILQSEIVIETKTSPLEETEERNIEKRKKETVSGTLLISDSDKKSITIVEEIKQFTKKGAVKKPKKIRHKVHFTNEAQRELVRSYYEEFLSVSVYKYEDNHLEFIDISQV
jgi:hypothetical protein